LRLLVIPLAVAALGMVVGVTVGAISNTVSNPGNSLSADATFPAAYGDAVAADNPVSHWKLDERPAAPPRTPRARTRDVHGGISLGEPGALAEVVSPFSFAPRQP
jgi:hypothetical protein